MYIVIPCYNEPDLLTTLQSVKQCDVPVSPTKVLVIINEAEGENEAVNIQNQDTFFKSLQWAKENSSTQLEFEIELHTLPKKYAGVGLARRIGMDIATAYYLSNNTANGVIVCLDADCIVAQNYLVEIERHFNIHPKTPAAAIYFEHDLEQCESVENRTAIVNYELFLRYYIEGLRFANYPYAFHTVGSSMAVRASIYKKQGGMNRRKAGEDFYFLHKIIPLGGFTEINTTAVYPSSRPSNRVPFGTGKAVNNWYHQKEKVFYTYHPLVYDAIKTLMYSIDMLNKDIVYKDWEAKLPKSVAHFLQQHKGFEGWENARTNSASNESFKNRYTLWWDGFRILKLVHFLRDNHYPNILLKDAAQQLIKNKKAVNDASLYDLLLFYREIQRI